MIWVKYILLLVFVAYVSWVYYKELDCISASAYQQGKAPLFSLFMFSQSFCLLPFMIEASSDYTKCIAFLIAMAVAFVGASPYYKSGMDSKVHKTACIIAMVLSVLWVWANHYYYAYIGLWLMVACLLLDRERWLFFLEVSLFLMIYICLFL